MKTQLDAVQLALASAIRLTARLDRSAAPDKLIFVPSVIVWALEQLEPSTIRLLREAGTLDNLIALLRHYETLRPIAESLRFDAYLDGCAEMCVDYDDDGYLTPEIMLHALEMGV